jgi:hypothetical protein
MVHIFVSVFPIADRFISTAMMKLSRGNLAELEIGQIYLISHFSIHPKLEIQRSWTN